MKNSSRWSMVGCILVAVWMIAGATVARATVFIYDARRYGTLPAAQGWTATVDSTGHSQNVVNGALVVVDGNNVFQSYRYSTNALAFGTTIPRETEWQMRTLMRIENNPNSQLFYTQFIATTTPNPRDAGWGALYTSAGVGSNRFYFVGENLTTPASGSINIPWDPNSFYQVVLSKPVGFSAGLLTTLEVFDATGTNLLGSITKTFTGFNDGTFTDPLLIFGTTINGGPTGTYQVQWASFGLGEAAPVLIPEPSTAMLGIVGGLLAYRRSRGRRSARA